MKYMYISNEYPWQIVDLNHVSLLPVLISKHSTFEKRKLFTGDKFDSTKVYFIKCFGPVTLVQNFTEQEYLDSGSTAATATNQPSPFSKRNPLGE